MISISYKYIITIWVYWYHMSDKRKIGGLVVLLAGIGGAVYLEKKGILPVYIKKLFGFINSKSGNFPTVTAVTLTPSQDTINDGSTLSVTWNITGGSGDFTGQLRWGDGSTDSISGPAGTVSHTYNIKNSLSQVIALILTVTDSKTGIPYRAVENITINPISGQNVGPGGGTVGSPEIEIDPGTVTLDSSYRLHVPVTYKNIYSQAVSFVALMQYVDSLGIVRALASINLSIPQGGIQSFEFVTDPLPPDLFTRATTVQLYAWSSLANPQALATVVKISLSGSQL
jgi:hypothetical protein